MVDLLALADACERASGPDRELDAGIQRAMGERSPEHWFADHNGNWVNDDMAPAYTTSIDQAMTLVPEGEGRWPQVYYTGPNPNNRSQGHRVSLWQKNCPAPIKGKSQHSFALALCAAALRARSRTQEGSSSDV